MRNRVADHWPPPNRNNGRWNHSGWRSNHPLSSGWPSWEACRPLPYMECLLYTCVSPQSLGELQDRFSLKVVSKWNLVWHLCSILEGSPKYKLLSCLLLLCSYPGNQQKQFFGQTIFCRLLHNIMPTFWILKGELPHSKVPEHYHIWGGGSVWLWCEVVLWTEEYGLVQPFVVSSKGLVSANI